MTKIIKFIVFAVILIVATPIIYIIGQEAIYNYEAEKFHKKYYPIVEAEYNKFNFAGFVAKTDESYEDSSCSYDHKVRDYRCSIGFTSFYATKNYPPKEAVKIANELQTLGWKSNRIISEEYFTKSLEDNNFMPSYLMGKRNDVSMEILVDFQDDFDLDNIDSFLSQSAYSEIQKAKSEGNYIYRISVSMDSVR